MGGGAMDIRVAGLRFSYNGREVLRGLDIEVERGGFVGVLGPNGSGKTTLVKLLTGVLKPMSGHIELMGEDVGRLSARRLARSVAVVPQATAVAFPFTALEVVLMGRAPHLSGLELEGPSDMKIAHEVMEMTGVWELRKRTMQELSGGEAQRVIVARALAQQPQVMLLDEPTTHLDIKHQISVMELLTKLNKERNITILIVSHDLNLVACYAAGVTLLKDGSVYSSGKPADVLTPDSIMQVYGASVTVLNHHGTPVIFAGDNA